VVSGLLRQAVTGSGRRRFLERACAAVLASSGCARSAEPAGGRLSASPGNYREALRSLRAGDVLALAAGEYNRGLPLHELVGTHDQPIVIEGPTGPGRAVFTARPGAHTVSLLDSAHLVVRNLVLDGRGVPVDGVRAEGHARWAHHVTLERLTVVNHGAAQQNSGISTKCPAWGWVVRGNTIVGAGTGMYFGDSDGSDPFFDSLIEANRIVDPVGYGIQVKHQHARPELAVAGEAANTVIRRNVIVKSRVATSPEMARPSLLVGHFPLAGPGAWDRYLVHGNLLIDNPSEALFQGEGNIALYNNLFFNPRGEGVRIQPHNHLPREVAVFNNTIVAAALGIEFSGGEEGYVRTFEHNLVYGNPPVRSDVPGENATGAYDKARGAFARLDADPARLDLMPRTMLRRPSSRIGDEWLALPGAGSDRIGRPRIRPAFGACGDGGAGNRACR